MSSSAAEDPLERAHGEADRGREAAEHGDAGEARAAYERALEDYGRVGEELLAWLGCRSAEQDHGRPCAERHVEDVPHPRLGVAREEADDPVTAWVACAKTEARLSVRRQRLRPCARERGRGRAGAADDRAGMVSALGVVHTADVDAPASQRLLEVPAAAPPP
jgi:hypothetical protein